MLFCRHFVAITVAISLHLRIAAHEGYDNSSHHSDFLNVSSYFGGSDNQDYVQWADSVGSSYTNAMYLPSMADSSDGAAVHWKINDPYIEIGLAVRATGWCGFGFSQNGGMTGSDIFIFEAANPESIQDYYVAEVRQPILDTCQNWEYVNSSVDSTDFIMVQARRKLNTGDTAQDLVVSPDAGGLVPIQRVISAWGDSATFGYHDLRRAQGAIQWEANDGTGISESSETSKSSLPASGDSDFDEIMAAQADGYFELLANYTLKPIETDYVNFCLTADDIRAQGVPLDQGVTIIGISPVITSSHIHHFVVSASNKDGNDTMCSRESIMEMVYGWAPGDVSDAYPDNIGLPFGGDENNYRSILINYHYDNPELMEGEPDHSGIRFYYSFEPRKYELGILQIGDPFIALYDQPVGEGLIEHTFTCQPSCSENALGNTSVTVFREGLHMHKSGIRAANRQYRNGELIRTGSADYYDFKQVGIQYAMQEPFDIKAGDSFEMSCYYRNDPESDDPQERNRTFGLGSSNEMCIAFLSYYPRRLLSGPFPWVCGFNLPYPDCNATWNYQTLSSDASIGRTFGVNGSQCTASVDSGVNGSGNGPAESPDSSSTNGTGSNPVAATTTSSTSMPVAVQTFLWISIYIIGISLF